MSDYTTLHASVVNMAVVLPRIAAAFLILPLLTAEVLPSLARNIFLVSVAISVYPFVAASGQGTAVTGIGLGPLVLKEMFIGVIIGYAFSIVFWAMEGAGQVIDAKIGTTTAQLSDPLSGHQTSLNGAFLSHLAAFLFVATGGFGVFLGLLLESYVLWPVKSSFPELSALGPVFFVSRFDELMQLTLLLAAPALALLTLVEFGLGFVNRYAEKLNIFSLSMSIKAWLGTFVLLLMLAVLVEFFVDWMAAQQGLLDTLRQIL